MKFEITNAQIMSTVQPLTSASVAEWANTIQSGIRFCVPAVALVYALGAYVRSIVNNPMRYATAGTTWLLSPPSSAPAVEPKAVKTPAPRKPRRTRTAKPKAEQPVISVPKAKSEMPIVMTQEVSPAKPRTRATKRTKAGFAAS